MISKSHASQVNRIMSTNKCINSLIEICEDLVSYKGYSSGIALASKILGQCEKLNKREKLLFFFEINKRFTPNLSKISSDALLFLENKNSHNLGRLSISIEGKRQELFRRINMATRGSEVLVSMRNDLLQILPEYPELKALDNDLIHLFRSWFNPGFLRLRK